MDTPQDDREPVYYDLQQLSFTPGMTDAEYAWIDKALTLGHPEDWPAGIDYTDYAYRQVANLRLVHTTRATNLLADEYHEYQQQHEVPCEQGYVEFRVGSAQAESMIRYAQGYAYRDDLLEILTDSRWSWYGTEEA